jgi:hypothetical protein
MKIDNTKALVQSVATAITLGAKVLEDGKVSLADFALFPEVFTALLPLKGIEFSQLLPEFMDLDQSEMAVLEAIFNEQFDLPGDSVEIRIENGLKLLINLVNAVLALTAVKK